MSEQQVYRLCTTFCDDQGATGNFPGGRPGSPPLRGTAGLRQAHWLCALSAGSATQLG
jgi:hypothetical protein